MTVLVEAAGINASLVVPHRNPPAAPMLPSEGAGNAETFEVQACFGHSFARMKR